MLIEDAISKLDKEIDRINKILERTNLWKFELSHFLPLPSQCLVLVSYLDLTSRIAIGIPEIDRSDQGDVEPKFIKLCDDMIGALEDAKRKLLSTQDAEPNPKENPNG